MIRGDDNEMYGLSCAISNVTPSDQSNKENETSPKSQFPSTSTLSKQEAFKKMSLEKNFSFGVFSEGSQKTCNEYTGPSHSKNVYRKIPKISPPFKNFTALILHTHLTFVTIKRGSNESS